MNRACGRPVLVSSDTVALVTLALSGWRATAGRFDPTVLGAVMDAGYDRSFDQLRHWADPPEPSGLSTGAVAVAVDDRCGTVALPAGVGFDSGGIGKGLAADMVVAELLAEGASAACVNIGGDLRAEGWATWQLDVADPFDHHRPPVARLAVGRGAVATSSRLHRTWSQGGSLRHHLIDPLTGEPADTDVAAVTVVTGEAWRAEVLGKAALLAGVAGAFDVLKAHAATGLVIDAGGGLHLASDLGPFQA
jgi:thiamine biosynthesis lipoprotein